MKIHDKYVIELAEVIKGFGNDYRVKEPANLPCDYKFYEISGVAICEESFKKMKPLDAEINAVLDKIRAEIDELDGKYAIGDYAIYGEHSPKYVQLVEVLRIIDKYKESEDT